MAAPHLPPWRLGRLRVGRSNPKPRSSGSDVEEASRKASQEGPQNEPAPLSTNRHGAAPARRVAAEEMDEEELERTISLTEALCGFAMELDTLDGRKLIIKSKPGEVIKPVSYDPFREEGDESLWEMYEDSDTPSLENAAVAETEDLNVCKKAVSKGQLKGKGIGCFVQKNGKTVFKQCSYAEAVAAKQPSKGSKLYIIGDPSAAAGMRMMKACEGEGLPRLKSPFEHGNLFIIIKIEFPAVIDTTAAKALLKVLPPPKHVPTVSEDSDDVDVCVLKDIDPVRSYQDNLPEASYEDEDEGGGGGQRVQCAQQ